MLSSAQGGYPFGGQNPPVRTVFNRILYIVIIDFGFRNRAQLQRVVRPIALRMSRPLYRARPQFANMQAGQTHRTNKV